MAIPRNLANIAPHVNASSTELVVNDGGANLDFRVEGDTDANTLFVDAGNDRVGIGYTVPQAKLHVSLPGTNQGEALRLSSTQDNAVIGTVSLGMSINNGDSEPAVKIEALEFDASDSRASMLFYTRATNSTAAAPLERARITSDGYLRMASGSGGIQFNGDTAAGNALDDYEEGTFTATYVPSGGAFTSITYDNQLGYYTKIGNVVHIQGYIRTDAITLGTAAGTIRIGGLPFAAANSNAAGSVITFEWGGEDPSALQPVSGNTQLVLWYRAAADGNFIESVPADLGLGANDNGTIFGITYRTS